MKRKAYEVPAIQVIEVKQLQQLLAGSNNANIDPYEDGEFNWAPELGDIENGIFSW